jgi:Protein of unknown function (DUF1318)
VKSLLPLVTIVTLATLAPAQTTDSVFKACLERMNTRKSAVEDLLLKQAVVERLDGSLGLATKPEPSPGHKALVDAENQDRTAVYAAMAKVEAQPVQDMIDTRITRVQSRYKQGILRETTGPDGKVIVSDGYSDEERLATYTIKVEKAPEGKVFTKAAHSIDAILLDHLQRPVLTPALQGTVFKLIAPSEVDAKFQPEAKLTDGKLRWSPITFLSESNKLELKIVGSEPLQSLNLALPPFIATDPPPAPEEIDQMLTDLDDALTATHIQNPSPKRDLDLIRLGSEIRKLLALDAKSDLNPAQANRLRALDERYQNGGNR